MGEDRVGTAASRATSISAAPTHTLRNVLEMLVGIPLDPDHYRNASRQDLFMELAPQVVTRGLTRGRAVGDSVEAITGVDRYDWRRATSDMAQAADRWLHNIQTELILQKRLKDIERYGR